MRERNNAAERGVRGGEATDFVVDEAGGFGGVDDIDLADVLLAFGIDDPDGAIFHDGFAERRETFQSGLLLGSEKNEVDVGGGFALGELRRKGSDVVEERAVVDVEDEDALLGLHAELVEKRAVGVITLGGTRRSRAAWMASETWAWSEHLGNDCYERGL